MSMSHSRSLVALLSISSCTPTASTLLADGTVGGKPTAASPGRCDDFQLDIREVWSEDMKGSLEAGFVEAAGSWGRTVSHSIETGLDTLSRNWVLMRRAACKDALERQVLSGAQYNQV